MYHILLIVQVIAVLGTFAGFAVLLRTKPSKVQVLMLATNVCVYLQSVGYLIEMTSTTFEGARVAICMEYAGGVYLNLFYAFSMFEYCKIAIPIWIRNALFGYSSFVYFNILTAPKSTFYYSGMKFVDSGLFPHMELEHGPLYRINTGIVMITILLAFIGVIYTFFKEDQENNRKRLGSLVLASMIPMVGYMVSMSKEFLGYYDPVSASAALACVITTVAILKGGLFDVVVSAHEHILETLEEAFIIVDENYNLMEVNFAAKELFPVLNHVPEGARVPRQIKELFREENNKSNMEVDGKFYKFHVQKLYNKEFLIGYAAVWFDQTENKKHYDQMKELKIQADMANREKSNFLARMSHEIRTPMNAIIGYSELILQERIDDTVERYALDIKSASNNLLAIINAILDISKIESGKFEIVEVDYFMQSLIYDIMSVILIPVHKKGLKFINEIDTTIPLQLYGDSIRIRQVMINLLNNAVKFTNKGLIKLSIQIEEKTEDSIVLVWKIEDTGKGIKEQDIEKIFGQFEQVDKKDNYTVEGTGLGLPISKSLVEAMGGTIEVESEYGKGTTFVVRLKQKIVDNRPIENISVDALIKEGRTKEKITFIAPLAKVLVVDDNPLNLELIREYLRHYKIVPDLADGGREAVELVQKNKYDVVFMDQMMPDMDGVETTDAIRKMGYIEDKLIIIALTANAISGTKEYLIQRGFNDYASKPISLKTLEELLLKYLPVSCIEYQTTTSKRIFGNGTDKLEGLSSENDNYMDVIDWNEGISYCGGNKDIYIQVLKAVSQHGEEKLKLIEQCRNNKDYERYVIEVHALKGNAASIGAKKMAELAKAQEMAGKEGRIDEIDANGSKLLADYAELLKVIEMLLEKNG